MSASLALIDYGRFWSAASFIGGLHVHVENALNPVENRVEKVRWRLMKPASLPGPRL